MSSVQFGSIYNTLDIEENTNWTRKKDKEVIPLLISNLGFYVKPRK